MIQLYLGFLFLLTGFTLIVLRPLRQPHPKTMWLLACFTPVFTGLIYSGIGGLGDYHAYLREQQTHQMLAKTKQRLQQNPQIVIQQLTRHMQQHPQDPKGWYLLGRLYLAKKRPIEAERAFRRALRLKPHDPDILYNTAQTVYRNQPAAANSLVDTLLKRLERDYPTYVPTYLLRAIIAEQHHQYTNAINWWQKGLTQLPIGSAEHTAIMKRIGALSAQQKHET